MRIRLSKHAREAAMTRMAWTEEQAIKYYAKNSEYEFKHGTGAYNVVAGGVLFGLAVDYERNEIRVMTICVARSFNESGYLGPLVDANGNRIHYSTRVTGV